MGALQAHSLIIHTTLLGEPAIIRNEKKYGNHTNVDLGLGGYERSLIVFGFWTPVLFNSVLFRSLLRGYFFFSFLCCYIWTGLDLPSLLGHGVLISLTLTQLGMMHVNDLCYSLM